MDTPKQYYLTSYRSYLVQTTMRSIQNDQLTRCTYVYVDSPKGDTILCLVGPVVPCGEVCQSETLWRIESSVGAYGIASGAKPKKT